MTQVLSRYESLTVHGACLLRAPLTEEQIDQLVNFMDLDSEGMVEYEEFLDSFIPVDSYCVDGGLPVPPDTPGEVSIGLEPNGGSSGKSGAQAKQPPANQKPAAAAASTPKGSKQPMEVDEGSRRFTFSSQVGGNR